MAKTFALDHVILTVNDTIIHHRLGYTAVIKSLTSRGNGVIEIPISPQNTIVWNGHKLPKTIKATELAKHFYKQPIQPKLL
jgi:hypothetical protein